MFIHYSFSIWSSTVNLIMKFSMTYSTSIKTQAYNLNIKTEVSYFYL